MKDKKINEQAEQALEIFCKKFAPVTDQAQATHFYTTTEIEEALKRLTPEAYASPSEVYEYLHSRGFRPTVDTSHTMLVYKWMLKVAPEKEIFTKLAKNT